jgi:transaldolase/glucose-6-phosphate isomerase
LRPFERKIDPEHTLFIVASKSGSTLEPNIMLSYFQDLAKRALKDKAGAHFVAITDPGSKLEALARQEGFWKVFAGDPKIGGRYSILSNFGLVPAAAAGVPIRLFLEDALRGVRLCDASVPPALNPGVQLGTLMGVAAQALGRDKLSIMPHPRLQVLVHGWSSWWRNPPASTAKALFRLITKLWVVPAAMATTGCLFTCVWPPNTGMSRMRPLQP